MSNEEMILEQLRRPVAPSMPRTLWSEVLPNLWQGGTADNDVIRGAYMRTPMGKFDKPQEVAITPADFDVVFTFYQYANPVDWHVREYRYGYYDADMSDFDPEEDLYDFVVLAHKEWKRGKRVLIRCQAGLNRSGLVSALVLIRDGYTADEAIALLRETRSSSVLFNKQFERWLRNLNPAIWRA